MNRELLPIPTRWIPPSRPIWRALYLVYRHIDVDYTDAAGDPHHLTHSLSDAEIDKATEAFRRYPALAELCSNGEALVIYDIFYVERPLTSLTLMGSNLYWVSPDDVRPELDRYVGRYDSLFVFWPQSNASQSIPSGGWGLAIGPCTWSYGVTYATVANASDWAWEIPTVGEPWLHEWLHGVSDHYASRGCILPHSNADGADSHGYVRSAQQGWLPYYRDLMTCQVQEGDTQMGITAADWQTGAPLGHRLAIVADYFATDTRADYESTGQIRWDPVHQSLILGLSTAEETSLYKAATFLNSFTFRGRVYIPLAPGPLDIISLALRSDDQKEIWASFAYGTDLDTTDFNTRGYLSLLCGEQTWQEKVPFSHASGWITLKVWVSYAEETIWMKAWGDDHNEPEWQLSRPLDPGWRASALGFRHYGQGSRVGELIALEVLPDYDRHPPEG